MPSEKAELPAPSPKRAHLMATAWRLFYRDGFRVVGIDTLLAEAQVAKMTLYNHFASKEDLIVAILEERSTQLRTVLKAAIKNAGRSPQKQLDSAFDGLKKWFESDDFKGCAFIRALSEYPEPNHPIHQTAWRHKQAVNALFLKLVTDAEATRPAELANMISLLFDGAILTAHATGSSASATTARNAAHCLLKQALN